MGVKIPSIETLLCEALKILSVEGRAAYLDRACGGDDELRRQVESLLEAHARAGEFLASPAAMATGGWDATPGAEGPGTSIGSYKLMEPIGEGGMGVVYVAEQRVPVRRKVALKVIKPGMDSQQVIARFEAERQALAMMDHPNIARIYDGGVTESGRPYFVMELVPGVPITEYCDRERLSVRQRLELFVLVCRAVQHAHQKGIIHRDLKPSNILVTLHDGVPVPKVIDFGIAKATGGGLTEKTIYTAFAQLVGTPLYMSPEQVELSGLDIDTRSDIYSLGVLLYELLTGTTPFDPEALRQAGFDEMRRIIREEEPQKPSTRLGTLGASLTTTSAKRSSDPRHLDRSVRGELDWIAMKALEKDRRRRYETANDFAADVMRHLTDRPVQACPPSGGYRFRKFARRHRASIITATVLAAALILGTAVSIWQAVLARRAERDAVAAWAQASREAEKAKRAQADTQAFSDFLVLDMLGVARPEGVQGGLGVGVTVARALEAAEGSLGERFAGRPLAEATARDAIGKTWRNLGKYEQAERHLRRAVELRAQVLGPDDPATLDSRNSLGVLLSQAGRYAEAIALHEETLEKWKAKRGPDHPNTLQIMNNLAAAYLGTGKSDQALPLLEETLERSKAKLGPDHPDTLASMNKLAGAYQAAGKSDQALSLLEETLKKRKAKLGADHPDTLESMNNLAGAFWATGRHDQALTLIEQVVEKRKAKLGPDHPVTLASMSSLASAYQNAGKSDQALPLLEETLEKLKAKLGPDHPDTLASMNNLAALYQDQGQFAKAEPLFVKTLEVRGRVLGEEHPGTLQSMNNLASLYRDQGQFAKAEPLYLKTLEVQRRVLGEEHPDTLQSMNNLAALYHDQGQFAKAEPLYLKTLEVRRRVLGEEHPGTLQSMNNLAALYWSSKKLERSVPLFEEVLKRSRDKLGPDHPDTLHAMANLGTNYGDAGRLPEGIALLEKAWEVARKRPGPLDESLAWIPSSLGAAYDQAGRFADSEPLYREALEAARQRHGEASLQAARVLDFMGLHLLKQKKFTDADVLLRECLRIREQKEPDDWNTFNAKAMLGASLLGQEKYAEAEPLLLSGYEGLKQREEVFPTQGQARLTEAVEALVRLYESTGDKDKADEWRVKLPVAQPAKPAETEQD